MRPLKGEEIVVIVLGMIIGIVGGGLCITLHSILKQKVEKARTGESEFADAGTLHTYQLNFQDPLTGYMEGLFSLDQHFLVLEVLIVCLVGWILSSTLVRYREKSLRKVLVFFHASAHELDRPVVPKPRPLKKSGTCKSLNPPFKEVFETTRVLNKVHDSLNFSSKRGYQSTGTSNLFSTISRPETKTFGGTLILQAALKAPGELSAQVK